MRILNKQKDIQKLIEISDEEISKTMQHITQSDVTDEQIDQEIDARIYFDDAIKTEPEICEKIKDESAGEGFTMDSEPQTGGLLSLLVASKPGGKFLELGTGYGYGAAWLLHGMDESSSLESVEYNPAIAQSARVQFDDPRLEVITADCHDFLRKVPSESYDLVFADAFAGKYYAVDEAIGCLKKGGFYVVDDLRYLEEWPMEFFEINRRVRQLIEDHPRLLTLNLNWATGLVIGVKR